MTEPIARHRQPVVQVIVRIQWAQRVAAALSGPTQEIRNGPWRYCRVEVSLPISGSRNHLGAARRQVRNVLVGGWREGCEDKPLGRARQ